VETREEMWHFVRSFAVGQFNKLCPLPEEQRILVQQDNMLRNIRAIKVMFSLLSNEINSMQIISVEEQGAGQGFQTEIVHGPKGEFQNLRQTVHHFKA